ncbi:glucans biosynthesis glucosyltransferase MdoH [Polymorphum gilvum]|uniref:Glucans biosynthesis glucosyltransferase H n=1 Tax=Polymorphum gilvum (strain LMG 25793 / CGMCC 1.9160 / SL003B-26A1) TaxID=991905 RepID=F2J494_POLGS|nr:glucans biosynthesis glucosyltransferase MdoH [Polymorphum gilvum]ADZ71036.1 Glycosyltransferase probably involved in cell wall biogenesis-like protein [Polymorphum gilvum SL003B-26A1]
MNPIVAGLGEGRLAVALRRVGALVLAVTLTVAAASMFGTVVQADGFDWVDVLRIALIVLAAFWLAWGACTAVLGVLFVPAPVGAVPGRPTGRTAILVPVYNESTGPVFARIEAMYRSVERTGMADLFDFHVLSDSTKSQSVADETAAYRRLLVRLRAGGRLYYRHRPENIGRKAGNIADFVRTSGGAYDYMLVLDADSLMRGETIVEMVRRMEAEPRLGLLQTLPQVIGLNTLFGRVLQFSAAFYAPVFARGVAALQGGEGPFWGHNALIRVRAFAESCGMAALSGKPPFGGHVLSHDTVEAAMLARDGWRVRLDPDLGGSFEEAPANVIGYAKRDRRWCQGNLQHSRIIGAPRFRLWSRISILQGIFAYLSSPIWLLFLIASLAAPRFAPPPVYFDGRSLFPVFPHPETTTALALLFGVVALLILPKAILLVRALLHGDSRYFGGAATVTASAVLELVLTSLLAPIHMMFQSRSVAQVVFGGDSGWPAADREDGSLSFASSLQATWWMSAGGLAALIFAYFYTPDLLLWLSPIAVPLVFAPVLVHLTSSTAIGAACRKFDLFLTPYEIHEEQVIADMREALRASGGSGKPAGAAPTVPAGILPV